jgi:predicted PurR-regulated permease PerM
MVLIGIFSLFALIFVPLVSEQVKVFGSLNIDSMINKVMVPVENFESYLTMHGWLGESDSLLKVRMQNAVAQVIAGMEFSSIIENVISFAGGMFVLLMAVAFITFFLLYEDGAFRKRFLRIIPNPYFEVTVEGLFKIEKLLSNYLLGLMMQMTSIFLLAFSGLSILGIKYAASIALFAAVINLIPYLGPLLGAIFGIVVGLSTSPAGVFTNSDYIFIIVKILAVFATVQVVDNIFLQPMIFSKSVKAHPLEIFNVIFAGATLAGIPGMIAAIPGYTVIRVSVMEIYRGYKSYHIFKNY